MTRGLFVVVRGLLSSCGVRVFSSLVDGTRVQERVGSVVYGTRALAEARELSSCGARA